MNGNPLNEIGASSPSIPGPYQSPEHTEAFPLKQSYRGGELRSKSKGLQLLSRCCGGSDKNGAGLHVIVMCFAMLTIAVIVALAIQIYSGDYQLVPHGSVATDHPRCSTIGTDILKKGGNAVDAAVAATFCMGVVNPHVTGLGGGGFMIIYSHRKQKVLDVVDFRETAPSTLNMSTSASGSVVGVPGFLRGLSVAHEKHGKLPWKEVVMPSVLLARNGFIIMDGLARMHYSYLSSDHGDLYNLLSKLEAGHLLTIPNLAAMLELIANKGADVFYNGSLAKNIVDTVAAYGGSMTAQDLAGYEAVLKQPALEETFAGFRVIVPGPPSGGKALLEILKNLPDLNTTDPGTNVLTHLVPYMVEAAENTLFQGNSDMKLADGSINFTKAAASHVSAVDLNDIYVSVVSGLNMWLGSQIYVNESFILNNALVNFGADKTHPTPGKRPISIATPVIAVERRRICGRRLVLGSGDSTIALQLLGSMLVLNKDINWSIESPRFHLENANRSLFLELAGQEHMSEDIIHYLNLSHKIKYLSEPYQSSNIVEKFGDDLASHSDSRGGGVASRF